MNTNRIAKENKKECKKVKKQNTKLRNNTIFSKSIENSMNKDGVKPVTIKYNTSNGQLDQPLKEKTIL